LRQSYICSKKEAMKKIITCIVIIQCFGLSLLRGQNSTRIRGILLDETGTPLVGGNIVIPGTSIGTSTDMKGEFLLEIPADTKLLSFSFLGYTPVEVAPEETMRITLQPDATLIDEVVIKAQKPTILITAEKTTVFSASSPLTSSGNTYNVLKNLPGVILNSDGTLFLNGKSGVKIQVDGKDSYLSGTDLVNYLIALPASSLNKIDLIHHPSARHDAAGNAGIIDISTLKSHVAGYHINYNTNYEQGKQSRSNNNISLGHHANKLSLNAMYGYYYGDDYVDLTIKRTFPEMANEQKIFFNQDSYRMQNNQSHYFNAGLDVYANPQTSIGISLRGNIGDRKETGTLSSLFYTPVTLSDSTIVSRTDNKRESKNISPTLNLQHKIDSLGKEISASVNGLYYGIDETQVHNDRITSNSDNTTGNGSHALKKGSIKMASGRADLALSFNNSWRLDAGVKSDFVDIYNQSDYKKMDHEQWINDPQLSSTFFYKENINAIYLSSKLNKMLVVAEIGLRVENTNIQTDEIDQSYTDLFPNMMISWHSSENNELSLTYNRRIDRPNYRDLNPFVYVFDSYTYEQGNTNLKPQFTDRINLAYTMRKAYKVGLFYNRTLQAIIKSYFIQPGTKRVIVLPTNMASFYSWGIQGDAGRILVADWFHTSIHAELVQNRYKWNEKNTLMENSGVTFQVGVQNHIRLPWGWTGEVSGFYNSRMAYGQIDVMPIYQISGGVQKNFFEGNATLSIFSSDWLHSNHTRVKGFISGGFAATDEFYDRAIIGISLSYWVKKGEDLKKERKQKEIDTKRISL
jgi:vitamin B12 transporter